MVKILRKSLKNHEAQFAKFSVFISQKSIFLRYCIQNIEDGIQIQVYNINNEIANHLSQFILANIEKNLRKSQAQFKEKLKQMRLSKNYSFLINTTQI